jgi:hypothetical protein
MNTGDVSILMIIQFILLQMQPNVHDKVNTNTQNTCTQAEEKQSQKRVVQAATAIKIVI